MPNAPNPALPINQLHLSVRTYNCLRRAGIATIGDVLARERDELLGLRNFGALQFNELRVRLLEFGFLTPGNDPGGGDVGAGSREPRPPRLPPSFSATVSIPEEPDEQLGTLGEALMEALRGHGDGGESAGTRVPRPHPLPPLPPASAPSFDEMP